MSRHKIRPLSIERLEDRRAPAVAHFRAGDGLSVVQDTFISATNPSAIHDGSGVIEVGGPLSAGGERQALIKFDNLVGGAAWQINPGSVIRAASLRVWAVGGDPAGTSISIINTITNWTAPTASWSSVGRVSVDGVTGFDNPAWNPAGQTFVTPGGYQTLGNRLDGAINYWTSVIANRGWTISVDDPTASWSFASSEHPDVNLRPMLTVEYTPIDGDRAPSYSELVGQPPLPTSLAWFDWADDLREDRVERVPLERETTFYFAQSGDDLTGWGTIDRPWKTLAKAQTILDAGMADVRLRFRRGDVWQENTPIRTRSLANEDLTIDDYGDPTLERPRFSRFLPLSSNWTEIGGAYAQMVTAPVGWVRDATAAYDTIFYRASSPAEVAARPNSWYCDPNGGVLIGSAMLYVNVGTNLAALNSLESCPATDVGWQIWGSRNVRLENLILEGQGTATSGQGYGLLVSQYGDMEFVGKNLDVFYTGYHSIGHIGHRGLRNVMTLIGCQAGLCVNRGGNGAIGSGDVTVYVSYAGAGGNEYYQYECAATYGTLPSSDWGAVPGMRHGQAFLSHTNGDNLFQSLLLCWKTDAGWCENPVRTLNFLGNPPPANDLSQVRAYIVEDLQTRISSWWSFPGSTVAINCVRDLTDPPAQVNAYEGSAGLIYGNLYLSGWHINCTLTVDASLITNFDYVAIAAIGNAGSYINCHFDVRNGVRPVSLTYPWIDPTIYSANMYVSNSIFSFETSNGITSLGAANTPSQLRHNAYFLSNPSLNTAFNYSNDLGAVTLSQPYPAGLVPTPFSPLYNGGVVTGLEYDQRRQPRGTLRTIGPLTGTSAPSATGLEARWGQRSISLDADTVVPGSTVDRIRLQFAEPVDTGRNALRLYSLAGSITPAAITAEPGRTAYTWSLAQPLVSGRYYVEFNGQIVKSFRVLPGDFDGNGTVDATDFLRFRLNYLSTNSTGDVDGDGMVTSTDFLRFRLHFLSSVI